MAWERKSNKSETGQNNSSIFTFIMNDLLSIKKELQLLKPSLLLKYNICELGLFGSIVRNDFSPESDIDILVDFTRPIGIEFIDLAEELEASLNRKVDLVSRKGIKPQYFLLKAISTYW